MYTQFDSSVEQVSRPAEARTEVQEEPVMAVPAGNDSDGTHTEHAQGGSRDQSIPCISTRTRLRQLEWKTHAIGLQSGRNALLV